MTRCDRPCYCSWPPLRRVMSTHARYTIVEIPGAGDGALYFRYHYLTEGA